MRRELTSVAVLAALVWAASSLGVSSAGTSPVCLANVDHAHVLRARGGGSVVHVLSGNRVELVLLQADRYASRFALTGSEACTVDLVRFEERWRKGRYGLHARLRSAVGSWEIRVTYEHYDRLRHILRARGLLEDHESAVARHRPRANVAQMNDTTEIVYASTFIPFNASF